MRPLATFECPERCIIQNVSRTPGLANVSKVTCLQEPPSLGSSSFSISGLQSSNTFMLLPPASSATEKETLILSDNFH